MIEKLKRWWWVFFFISVRVWLAFTFPIFNDESIYALWARSIGAHFTRGLWPVLMDGKQPGLMIFWSMIVGIGNDPVFIIRCSSIGFGLVTTWMIFRMYTLITSNAIQWWRQLIYILVPGIVWYEGLGLQESAVMMVGTAIVYWSLLRVKKQDWGVGQGVILGLVLSMGMLIKPTALFTFGSLIFVIFTQRIHKKMVMTLLIGMSLAIFSSQLIRNHQGYLAYRQRSSERRGGVAQLIQQPSLLFDRIQGEGQWILWWVGPLGLFGLFMNSRTRSREKNVVMFGWIGVLIASLGSGPGIFTSRYIVAAYPLLALSGLLVLKKSPLLIIGTWSLVTFVIIGHPFLASTMMRALPAVASDFSQYIYGWTSGWGVREAIDRVRSEMGDRRGIVLVRADSGNPESAVAAYLWDYRNITVINTVNAKAVLTQKLEGGLAEVPIYFISRGNQFADLPANQLNLVATYPKPLDSEYVGVFELK